jgi:hypothetical protein
MDNAKFKVTDLVVADGFLYKIIKPPFKDSSGVFDGYYYEVDEYDNFTGLMPGKSKTFKETELKVYSNLK